MQRNFYIDSKNDTVLGGRHSIVGDFNVSTYWDCNVSYFVYEKRIQCHKIIPFQCPFKTSLVPVH